MFVVWFHVTPSRWCVLRQANAEDRISTLCADGLPYQLIAPSTSHPEEFACPACERELRAGTPGAAVAVEPEPYDDLRIEESRVPTENLRGKTTISPEDIGQEWGE